MSGRNEVYVQPFPEGGSRTLVSIGGATEPVWSPNRLRPELFYRQGDDFIAVTFRTNPRFEVVARTALFTRGYWRGGATPQYDVSPDGQRFAVIRPMGDIRQMVAVLNLFANLGRGSSTAAGSTRYR